MENGSLVQTKRKGTIAIEAKKGKMYIQDLLPILDLEPNFLSVEQLIEHRYSLRFEWDFCKIYDWGGENKLWQQLRWRIIEAFLSLYYIKKYDLRDGCG